MLGPPAKIEIELEDADKRQTIELNLPDNKKETLPLFIDNEGIKGTVHVKLEPNTKKIDHQGVRIALIGSISK